MASEKYSVRFVSVVTPVFNEEECLQELIDRVLAVLKTLKCSSEFILVDDGSSDSSAEIIRSAAEKSSGRVIGCILNRNYGQHAAITAGFELVRGDLVITLDADLQNPPEEIPRLIAAAEEGCDVVGTFRVDRQDTLFRRLASRIVNAAARKITGVQMNDFGCMLRAYRRFITDAVLKCNERSTFIPVLANSFAKRTCEIPVTHAERKTGRSKYSLRNLIELQFNLMFCMNVAPLRLLIWSGLLTCALGVLLCFYIIVCFFCNREMASLSSCGTFTLFALLFVFTGIQMIGIGVSGEYLGRLYNDVRARPRFFVEEVIGLNNEEK